METLEKTNALVKTVESSGLENQTAATLKEKFLPFFEKAEEWKTKAEALIVTDASQTREMKMAREARLALKDIRVNADKVRKELKEDSLRYGKAVQGVYNVIESLVSPIETHLENQERFVEIQDAKRKEKIKEERHIELAPFQEFIPFGINLGEMTEEDYGKLLNGAKLKVQARIDAEKAAKEKAIAEERERERIRIENEKLKAEAKKQQAILEAERKKADDILEAQRKQAAKKQAELQARIDADAKAKREEEERVIAEAKKQQLLEKKAKSAPDKDKLESLAKFIDEINMPELATNDAKVILQNAKALLSKVSAFIREKSTAI